MMIDETSRFDEALRSHHRASLAQVSPNVRAQLVQRRHAALRGTSPHHSHRLGFAAAGFAGGDDELRLTVEDLGLGADDVAADG